MLQSARFAAELTAAAKCKHVPQTGHCWAHRCSQRIVKYCCSNKYWQAHELYGTTVVHMQ
eukprot:20179-Heterococcus_DN1.PRE.1